MMDLNKGFIARKVGGIWAKREDLGNIELYIRGLRKSNRTHVFTQKLGKKGNEVRYL